MTFRVNRECSECGERPGVCACDSAECRHDEHPDIEHTWGTFCAGCGRDMSLPSEPYDLLPLCSCGRGKVAVGESRCWTCQAESMAAWEQAAYALGVVPK